MTKTATSRVWRVNISREFDTVEEATAYMTDQADFEQVVEMSLWATTTPQPDADTPQTEASF